MATYKPGDKFILEIDRVYTDTDGNTLYGIKGFNALVFDELGLNKLTSSSPCTMITERDLHREYSRGWNDGVNEAFSSLMLQLKSVQGDIKSQYYPGDIYN